MSTTVRYSDGRVEKWDDNGNAGKHTPGPWHIGTETEWGVMNADQVNDADGKSVCAVYGLPMRTDLEGIVEDARWAEGLANARLIAAAPELLEALIKLEAMAERYRPEGAPLPDAQKQARAVIAKSTGAQP